MTFKAENELECCTVHGNLGLLRAAGEWAGKGGNRSKLTRGRSGQVTQSQNIVIHKLLVWIIGVSLWISC